MQISIAGPPNLLFLLFQSAATAMNEDGSFSFAGIEDENGNELTIDFEADPSEDSLSWEQI